MLDGNIFLPGDRHAHLKDGPHQNGIGGLAARAVHRGDLNTKIIDHGTARRRRERFGG